MMREDAGHNGVRSILVREFKERFLPADELTLQEGELLYREYGDKVKVEFPSPQTGGQWKLKPRGWVGAIPVGDRLLLRLMPKTEIGNLFRMLEYAYDLKSFHILDGLVHTGSLEDLYSRLARLLAELVLERSRRGLYRDYVPQSDYLPFVRGALDLPGALAAPWRVALPCAYEEHTPDVPENRIPAWTLQTIMRHGGICREDDLSLVRRAWHGLAGSVAAQPAKGSDCLGILYNRLNEDYRPIHALCRFFLENIGPSHHAGGERMLPFLVDMARLYESFVGRWIGEHLPEDLVLTRQETIYVGNGNRLSIHIDLVISRVSTGEALCVLDTKYKKPKSPSSSDLSQIVSYAVAKKCRRGVLVYPEALAHGINQSYAGSDIFVRTMTFATATGDPDDSGTRFLEELLDWCGVTDRTE